MIAIAKLLAIIVVVEFSLALLWSVFPMVGVKIVILVNVMALNHCMMSTQIDHTFCCHMLAMCAIMQ